MGRETWSMDFGVEKFGSRTTSAALLLRQWILWAKISTRAHVASLAARQSVMAEVATPHSPRKPPLPPRRPGQMRRVRSAASVGLGASGGAASLLQAPPLTPLALPPLSSPPPQAPSSPPTPNATNTGSTRPEHGVESGACTRSKPALLRRLALRTLIYLLYDVTPITEKESTRVGRVLMECALDEWLPIPARHELPGVAKCLEYLAPPALSTVLATALGRAPAGLVCFATAHRTARQALINRLFFRLGSREYAAVSALGLVCCFFHAGLLFDLGRPSRWATHFAPRQGATAVARSTLYALAFATPLPSGGTGALIGRRRCNLKRLIFALLLAQIHGVRRLLRLVASATVSGAS